jgi:hypothetical protein
MDIKGEKIEGEKRDNLEKKIDQDNKKICKFFEDSFGKSAGNINEDEIEGTYMHKNPRVTIEGWDEIKSYLEKVPNGTKCQAVNVYVEVNPITEEDFDLKARVKTAFSFGGTEMSAKSDPGGEGDLRHRRTCVWEP